LGTRAASAGVAAKGNGAKLLTAADAVVRGCPATAGGGATKLDSAGMTAAAVVAFVPVEAEVGAEGRSRPCHPMGVCERLAAASAVRRVADTGVINAKGPFASKTAADAGER
jgi:hypothetical protein